MAQTALPAPQHVTARRRAFFGLFNADGWPWAFVKALFWFVVIIVMLGYIPDRAYYFTVQRTVDVGLLAWSPVNLCPPENTTLPCPVPAGATMPWYPGPAEASLPAPRTDGSAGVIGLTYVYAGGSDGSAPSADTFVSTAVGTGNIDKWAAGPALPEARADAASVVSGNTLYVIGGYGPDGQPTTTVFSLKVENDGSARRVGDRGGGRAPRAARGRVCGDGLRRPRPPGRHGRHRRDAERLEEHDRQDRRPRGVGAAVAAVRGERLGRRGPHRRRHLPGRRPQQGRRRGRHGPAGPRGWRERLARGSQRHRRPVARERADQPALPAGEHVGVHGERRALCPGRHRRKQPAQRDPVGRPRRRGRDPRVAFPGPDRPRRGPRGLVRRRLGFPRLPVRRDDLRGSHGRRRPHQPRTAGAVLPAGRSSGRRCLRSSCRERSVSRSATSTPRAWARSTSSS